MWGEDITVRGRGKVGVEVVIIPISCFIERMEQIVKDVKHEDKPIGCQQQDRPS